MASHSPPLPPGPSFEDGVLVAALWDVQAELALQQVSVQVELALQQVSVQQASVQAELASQQVSVQQVSAQAELASQQVSVQQVSVQAELASRQVSVQKVSAQQAAWVESRSPVWQELAPASPQAAYEQLTVYLAPDAPVLGSYFQVAPLQQAASQALLQRPDEEHTGFAPGAALAATALCCSSATLVAGRGTAAWAGTP